jgi:hypothetical protein
VPLVGPEGAEGVLTISVVVLMFTVSAPDNELSTELFVADRACAVTLYDPADQLCEAEVVPVDSHPELLPSPQLNWYCTGLPRLSEAPPVE